MWLIFSESEAFWLPDAPWYLPVLAGAPQLFLVLPRAPQIHECVTSYLKNYSYGQKWPRTIYIYEKVCRNSILMIWKPKKPHIWRNIEKMKKTTKTWWNESPATLKMQFRSADAANRVNREDPAPGATQNMTRRAYIPKIYKLRE